MNDDLDLISGTPQIAEFLGVSARRAMYLCEKKQIPVFKMGHIWCARRSTLNTFIARRDAEALQRISG
jgi:hypothetical protein